MKLNLIALLLLTSSICCTAQKEFPKSKIPFNPEGYVCYRSNTPINIDGKLDETEWEKAEWTNYFVDIEGDMKPKPYYDTRVKMLWDDKYFYFACLMEEEHIWAKLTERDAVIFYDNDFEIFIDPDGDTHKYFEFEINAFNTQWDLLITKPYRDDREVALDGWDINGLKTAIGVKGTVNDPSDKDEYWIVEVAYPWKALEELSEVKSPPSDGDQWRVNFSRVQWETEVKEGEYVKKINPKTGKHYPENNWVWSPQGLIAMHAPETWGFVQFSDNTVGTDKSEFKYNPVEDAKWELRKVYYAQHDYRLNNGSYTTDLKALKLDDNIKLKNFIWPPKIKTTSTQFEAILESKDGKSSIIIHQDGLVNIRNTEK